MAHPIYKVDGTRVPSVTTVLGRFKESGALMHWAWRMGMEGTDYRAARDSAASAGTLAHAMVEAHIRQHDMPDLAEYPEDVRKKAETAFNAFLKWADKSHLKPAHTETSLVSEKYRFGGTLDTMFVDGELAVGDWKSSNGIYSDMLCQVAAYGKLWEENHPDQPITGGFHIVRFDKEHGDFAHHWYSELDDAWKYFALCREAYDLDKKLRKRV